MLIVCRLPIIVGKKDAGIALKLATEKLSENVRFPNNERMIAGDVVEFPP